ncbi:Uncharacterized protein APZ42_006019 [Daphnia magna]|uniref:Uncharacterized protein n=1 Tax=Daphnia magna TaxID=35525 RepID=A0A164G4J7_9CRUS|nr:Uncharacterized protein APZ42_006019 [Daphnia magna]
MATHSFSSVLNAGTDDKILLPTGYNFSPPFILFPLEALASEWTS